MRAFLQRLFSPSITWLGNAMASAPNRRKVFRSLSRLLKRLEKQEDQNANVFSADLSKESFIIFSDHHKGNKDHADDFAGNESNYLAALEYYHSNNFKYINLGDGEELWKYSPKEVISKNVAAFTAERKFQDTNGYYKTYGNHDLIWKHKLDVRFWFKGIFAMPLPVYEGILIKTEVSGSNLSIFLTHGHQGDMMSDNNILSTWFVAHLWQPVQRYLRININTPATDYDLRGNHNIMMYEWSSKRKGLILITGHTHKPVFASGKYSDHKNNTISHPTIGEGGDKHSIKPSYFNSGCCCYNDGDITGIEISEGRISLVRWHTENNNAVRIVLEETTLNIIVSDLYNKESVNSNIPLSK